MATGTEAAQPSAHFPFDVLVFLGGWGGGRGLQEAHLAKVSLCVGGEFVLNIHIRALRNPKLTGLFIVLCSYFYYDRENH